jgi:hypothetical protein
LLITTCPFCLRHRPQRPPPCHPPPSLILASTYEIDASPPSYSHLIMPCRHFRRVHITFSTTTAIYTCSTHRRATCCHAIYAVTMPFHSIDCCCHNDFDAALTPPPQPHIRPSILVPSPFDPKSTRTQCSQRSIKAFSRHCIPQHGIIAPTSCPLDMSHRMIYIFVWPFCNSFRRVYTMLLLLCLLCCC